MTVVFYSVQFLTHIVHQFLPHWHNPMCGVCTYIYQVPVCVHALRIVSSDQGLRDKNTLIIIHYYYFLSTE